MKRLVIAGMMIALGGCQTMTPEANAVREVNSERAIAGCQFVTSVRGDQNVYGGMLFARAAYDDAINQMKAKTASAGGNTLYVQTANISMMGGNARGDAYRC